MASRKDSAVFVPMNGTRVDSPTSFLPGKSLQPSKDLVDSVKILSAVDSFGFADEMFNGMAGLERSAV